MSLENAILKLAEAMNNNAEAIRESNKPIIEGFEKPIKTPVDLNVEIKNPTEALEYEVDNEKNEVKFKEKKKSTKTKKEEISIGYKPAEEIAPVEKQSKSITKVELKKEVDEVKKITFEDVQQIATSKMKGKGIDRKVVKKIITDIKTDAQISDLNDEELVTAYNQINAL